MSGNPIHEDNLAKDYIDQFINFGDIDQLQQLAYGIQEFSPLNCKLFSVQQILLRGKGLVENNDDKLTSLQSSSCKSSRNTKSQQALAKYRQKKKKYVQDLQEQVKSLQNQINETQRQITLTKDNIVTSLESLSKTNINSHENGQIYNRLETLVQESSLSNHEVNIDEINLLIDTLKYRIGASGRERQAKINYNFKNIINTLFPALFRYLMIAASSKTDVFSPEAGIQSCKNSDRWTSALYDKIDLSPKQLQRIRQYQGKLANSYTEALKGIVMLKTIKQKLKQEQLVVDRISDQIRESLSPIQCGKMTIFCQKSKYRQELSLIQSIQSTKSRQSARQISSHMLGRKMIKRS